MYEGFAPPRPVQKKLPILVYTSDMNSDGDEDVIASLIDTDEENIRRVAWYENTESTLPVDLASFNGTATDTDV